jgi:hypothetical protein
MLKCTCNINLINRDILTYKNDRTQVKRGGEKNFGKEADQTAEINMLFRWYICENFLY